MLFSTQVLNSLENKKRGVLDFLSKGEKLMKDPNCPKFLESHVQKLKEAWEDTNEKAQKRKKELEGNDNFISAHLVIQDKAINFL